MSGPALDTDEALLVINAEEVRRHFTLDVALRSQRTAFRAIGNEVAVLPERLLVAGADDSTAFCYAARCGPTSAAVSKFGSTNPANTARGLPTVHAVIMVLDAETGQPSALVDGTSVTELRTAAASAVAAEVLAPVARRLGIVGAGVQALAHIRAFATTHALDSAIVWDQDRGRLNDLVEKAALEGISVQVATSSQQAVESADLVLLCTTSVSPVIEASWLSKGAVVFGLGSTAPDRHEVGQDLLRLVDHVYVDDVDTALQQAGPIMEALRTGVLADEDVVGLGSVLVGKRDGPGLQEIAYYNTVGVGVQDAAAATEIVDLARKQGFGQRLILSSGNC